MEPNNSIIQKTCQALEEHSLLTGTRRLLIAVSGGRDSVALLVILKELLSADVSLMIGHIHHGLRKQEADADEAFVCQLAKHANLPFILARLDLSAELSKSSFEIPARKARYKVFMEWAETYSLDAIATGHTADDQVETFFLRLLRGCSLTGLSGIPFSRPICNGNNCRVIRPLMNVSRSEITAFLNQRSITFRNDSSNGDCTIPRNRIRHQVLPLISKHFNPNLHQAILHLQREAANLKKNARAEMLSLSERIGTSNTFTLAIDSARRLSYAASHELLTSILVQHSLSPERLSRINSEQFRKLCKGETEAITLPQGLIIKRYGKILLFTVPARQQIPSEMQLELGSKTLFGNWSLACKPVQQAEKTVDNITNDVTNKKRKIFQKEEVIDGRGIKFPLQIRSRSPGDRFRHLGSGGHKKLKEFFRSSGIPPEFRQTWPLVCSGDEIIWIPGLRISETVKIKPGSSIPIQLEVKEIPEEIESFFKCTSYNPKSLPAKSR